MPTNSLPIFLKRFRLLALGLLFPVFFYGQSLTGLWTGIVSNDSATSRKDQSFEIALTEYKGKVYGYSRSEFIVNDTLYYIVKRVKGTIDGDICEVVDDEIMSYNFIGRLDKGVKVTSTFRRNRSDSIWYLAGTWKTNATKKYYTVTGKLNLGEEKDLTASKLFPHLEELKLADDVAFYKERVDGNPIVRLIQPDKIKTEYNSIAVNIPKRVLPEIKTEEKQRAEIKTDDVALSKQSPEKKEIPDFATLANVDDVQAKPAAVNKPGIDLPKTEINKAETSSVMVTSNYSEKLITQNAVPEKVVTKPETDLPKTELNKTAQSSVDLKPNKVNRDIVKNKIPAIPQSDRQIDKPLAVSNNSNSIKVNPQTTNNSKPNTISTKPTTLPVATSTESNKPTVAVVQPAVIEPKTDVEIIAKAANIAGRKSEFSQIVSFKSDSLELSLYDNGEIDGDTVSIFLNGEVIMSRQGLKSTAIKKTVHINQTNEQFTLVLFAENLGKYPPNTGLLVVHDGEDVYNLRFSADYQKNAGIIFRRKK